MAAPAHAQHPRPPPTTRTAATELSNDQQQTNNKLLSSYLGLAFAVYLGLTRNSSLSSLSTLQSANRDLYLKLVEAKEQLEQVRSRRKEDSKANARVVEIFASHRHAWRREEERLLRQIDVGAEEIVQLRERTKELEMSDAELRREVEELRKDVGERDEMLNFMTRRPEFEDDGVGGGGCGGKWCSEAAVRERFGDFRISDGLGDPVGEEFLEKEGYSMDEMGVVYGNNGFKPELKKSASKFWAERASIWQDVEYESLKSLRHLKHFASRRESPWKVDGEASGVSSKLKILEQELLNLERIGKSDLSKLPAKMRKQTRRYQALSGKIDDLCRRMQASDPSDPTLSSEFRTQRHTEFLIEAFRLQQRASETGQKLMAIQSETGKGYFGDEMESQAILITRRCLDYIKKNFKEIQRNLEIWLARIIGDVEGILSRDGASCVREYYVSRYPFVQ